MASKKNDLVENTLPPSPSKEFKFGQFLTIDEAKVALKKKPVTLEQVVLNHLKSKLD